MCILLSYSEEVFFMVVKFEVPIILILWGSPHSCKPLFLSYVLLTAKHSGYKADGILKSFSYFLSQKTAF